MANRTYPARALKMILVGFSWATVNVSQAVPETLVVFYDLD